MNLLIKTVLILAGIFFSTFLIIKFTGVLTVEDIKTWFETIKSKPSYMVGFLVILLLFADLFIAVPTMTIIILAGYFLGFEMGALYAFLGLLLASFTGYGLSWVYGEKILNRLSKDKEQKEQMKTLFREHGMIMLILSRAAPMITEISCCLAGTCKMPFYRFLLGWSLGTIPYLLIVSYAGSISDLSNPKPALFAGIGVALVLWLSWAWFIKKSLGKNSESVR